MIVWKRRSGPIHYQSADHCYSVQEGYRWGRFGYAAMFTGCLHARALGPIRETAEEARSDAEKFESGAVTWAELLVTLSWEKEQAEVRA